MSSAPMETTLCLKHSKWLHQALGRVNMTPGGLTTAICLAGELESLVTV